MVDLQLIFKENAKIFSKIVIPFHIFNKSKSSNKCAKELNSQVSENDCLTMTYHLQDNDISLNSHQKGKS